MGTITTVSIQQDILTRLKLLSQVLGKSQKKLIEELIEEKFEEIRKKDGSFADYLKDLDQKFKMKPVKGYKMTEDYSEVEISPD